MNIQWYPGHMTKARREMEADVRIVDMVIELLDARAPMASGNPEIRRLGINPTSRMRRPRQPGYAAFKRRARTASLWMRAAAETVNS